MPFDGQQNIQIFKVLAYMFGDYRNIICEGIMQAIVMHPFDIGDHYIINNDQVNQYLFNFRLEFL